MWKGLPSILSLVLGGKRGIVEQQQGETVTAGLVLPIWWHHMATPPCHKVGSPGPPAHFPSVCSQRGEATGELHTG